MKDHCHLAGKYRGAAHSFYNINLRILVPILVVFHNLKGHDANLLFLSMACIEGKKMTCIPNNMENYISFSLGDVRFIDGLNFCKLHWIHW